MAKKRTSLNTEERKPKSSEILSASLEDTSAEDEKPVRFNFDMPRTLHKAFKLKALQNDESMTDVVLRLIRGYVE